MKFKYISIIFVLTMFSNTSLASNEVKISKDQFGNKWPLSIESGIIKCLPIGQGAVVLTTEDKTYAVNGIAQGVKKKYGFISIDTVWLDDPEFYKLAEAGAKSEKISVEKAIEIMGGPTKMNLSPILNVGSKLCR